MDGAAMTRVLLLGAGGNAGINFVKCLRMDESQSYYVVGTDTDRYNAAVSNADVCVHLHARNEEEKVEQLRLLVHSFGIDVIHAQPDAEVGFLLRHRKEFHAEVFAHSRAAWETFRDKRACQAAWSERTPFLVYEFDQVGEGEFEGIIRQSEKAWVRAIRGAGSRAALPVTTLEQARAWVDYWVATRGLTPADFMVSEYLPGTEYAVQTFWVRGSLVQSQARERVVHFFANNMPSGQSSTPAVAKTVADRDVYEAAYHAISDIDREPHGIYCVDMRRNVEGACVPTEVNYGRFFTTTDFFASLGVNGPACYLAATMGRPFERSVERVAEEWLWLRGLDRVPTLKAAAGQAAPAKPKLRALEGGA